MKPELLRILRHSLGLDEFGRGKQYRNGFITGPESDDFPKCSELCDFGFMKDHGVDERVGSMHLFNVTPDGVRAVENAMEVKKAKVSRAKITKDLLGYVRHQPGCSVWRPIVGCDCGLVELVKAA